MGGVYVEDLMPVVTQITNHPAAGLAAAPGHDDPHLGSDSGHEFVCYIRFLVHGPTKKEGRRTCLS